MKKTSFLNHLAQLDEAQLRDELLQLYNKLDAVKKHYKMELGSDKDRERIYSNAKKQIQSKYATKSYRRPRRPRIQKLKSLLKKLHKEAIFDFEMIDIYLFDIETALLFSTKYRFYSSVLERHIWESYRLAELLTRANFLESKYQDKLEALKANLNKNGFLGY